MVVVHIGGIGESSGKWQNENLTVIFKTSFYFKMKIKTSFYFKMKTMAISAGLEIKKNRHI